MSQGPVADSLPRFSIVTPVYNGMPWLPEAMRSLLAQEGVSLELIVLDGGSTDGSREWLEANLDGRATLIFEPDLGQTHALRRGLALATGEYLGWLNADDVLEPGALRRAAQAFHGDAERVIVSGCCLLIDERGSIIGAIGTPPNASLAGLLRYPNNLAQPATFFRADTYRRSGGVDTRYNLAMDVDLWMKLAASGRVTLLPDAVLARFRLHRSAKSVASLAAAVKEDLAIRRRHGMRIPSRAWLVLLKRAYLRPLKLRILRRGW